MLSTSRPVRRLLVGAALLAVAGAAPLQAVQAEARRGPLLAPQPFDHDFTMILNLGVLTQGLSWRTVFPAELVIDYAKAWR